MRELNVNEMEQVSGGWKPLLWAVGGVIFDSAVQGYTGKGVSDWLAPAFEPYSPHDAYYYGNIYISP